MEMTTQARYLDRIFPVMGIKDGIIVSKTGDLTVGWEVTLPKIYSLTKEEHNEALENMASAISILEPWMMVQRKDQFTSCEYHPQMKESFLSDSYEQHFKGRRYMTHRQWIFLTLSNKRSATRRTSNTGIFSNLLASVKPLAANAEKLLLKAQEFESVLTGKGTMGMRRMDDYELTRLIWERRNLGADDGITSDIKFTPESVCINDRVMWAYSIGKADDLPATLEPSQKVAALSTINSSLWSSCGSAIGPLLDCEHEVNQYILTLPQKEMLPELDGRRRKMLSMSSRSAENRNNAEELEEFMDTYHSEKTVMVSTHTDILAWGPEGAMKEIRSKVSASLSGMGITCVQNKYDTPVSWFGSIPGASCEIGSDNLMLAELRSILCLGINETYEQGIPGGIMKMCDRSRNIPVEFDMQKKAYDLRLIDNYNAFILGGSGSGKSFFTNYFVRSCYDAGEKVFIIDVGDSYQGLCSIINEESGGQDGIYHTWDENDPISFNAFMDFGNWTEGGKLNADNDGVNFLLSFLQTLWEPSGGWSSESATILKAIIRDFANDYPIKTPVFQDLIDFIRQVIGKKFRSPEGYDCGGIAVHTDTFNIDGLLLSMEDYSRGGAFGFLLNNPNPKDLLKSRFTVFEVEKLSSIKDKKFYSLVILCIMNAFNAMMRSTPGFKVMVIEEAWKAIANETMAPFLSGLWKTARKYQTSAVVVTQQISDIMSSAIIHDTILQNSAVKVLLDQSNNVGNFDSLMQLLGLDEQQKGLILSMNRRNRHIYRYKEVFISLGGKKTGVYATEVSPQEAIAYESDKEKKKEFLSLSAELGPVEAIRKLTGGDRS